MLADFVIALDLLVCFMCFASVNLHNILVTHRRTDLAKSVAEVERPGGLVVGVAGFGTLAYFVEAFLFQLLVFSGSGLVHSGLPVQLPFSVYLQVVGVVLTLIGHFVSIWSVIVRGRYSVSWAMPEDQKLVTWGPYRYVRNPSYLGYFLMFLGLFLSWPNVFTVLPLFAIPGYYRAAVEEERFLVKRFGDVYLEYQRKTGRFIPKISWQSMLI